MNNSATKIAKLFPVLSVAFSYNVLSEQLIYSESLFEKSLEDLLTITIVSNKKESIIHSPAIVSSYRYSEFKDIGLRTLSDLIDFIPGFQVNQTINGNSPIQARGLSDNFNQKILFMVNDVPYWMPAHGEFPLYGIPVESIEKIEAIRGPGGVQYGTNASAGVINIVTKSTDKSSLSLEFGENNRYQSSIFHQFSLADKYRISLAAEVQNDDGTELEVRDAFNQIDLSNFTFASDLDGRMRANRQHKSIYVDVNSESLNLIFQTSKSENLSGADGSFLSQRNNIRRGSLLHVEYQEDHGNFSWQVYSDLNRFFRELPTTDITALAQLPGNGTLEFDNNGKDNIRRRVGFTSHYERGNFRVFSGLDYESRQTENYRFKYTNGGNPDSLSLIGLTPEADGSVLIIGEQQSQEKSAFLDFTYRNENWYYKVGTRFIENDNFGSENAPSASIVYQLSPQSSFKLLYSLGFNSPTFAQTSEFDQLGRPISKDIEPEIIETIDLAFTYTSQRHHFVANAFHIRADKLINSIGGRFENFGKTDRNGFEIDYQFRTKAWSLYSNVAYLDEGNKAKLDDPTAKFSSRLTMGYGLSWKNTAHSMGSSLRYLSERGEVDPYYWLNLNYHYQFSNIQFHANLDNALGDNIIHPDVGALTPVKLQVVSKNSFSIGIKSTF